MKKIIIYLLIFYSIALPAQVAGYMGKRATLVYSFGLHPASAVITNFFGTQNPNQEFSLNTTHIIEFNYMVKPKGAVSFVFDYSHLGLGIEDTYDNRFSYSGSNAYPAILHLKAFCLGYKFFSRNRIAPLGSYMKWEGVFVYNTMKYDTKGAFETVQEQVNNGWGTTTVTKKNPVTDPPGKVNSFGGGISMSLGRQKIFFDKIVFDMGVRFAFVLAPDGYSITAYAQQFPTFSRTFFNQLVNFKIGLGFLAF